MRPYSESDRMPDGPRLLSRGSFVKLLLGATAASGLALAARPSAGSALVAHPRLMITSADITRIKGSTDPNIVAERNRVIAKANSHLSASLPPSGWGGAYDEMFLDRMVTCGGAYKLTGATKYADRCVKEVNHLCNNVSNWAPDKWLTMGATAAGVAIGYDWAFERFTPTQRTNVQAKVKSKCFDKILARTNELRYNWNIITNCGIGMLALALEGDGTTTQEGTIQNTLEQVDKFVRDGGFTWEALPTPHGPHNIIYPSGGYKEGPSYWGFAMNLATKFLASWRTARGVESHFVSDVPGLSRTAYFAYAMADPTFNYTDMSDSSNGKMRRRETVAAGYFGKLFNDDLLKWLHARGRALESTGWVSGQFAFLSMLWDGGPGVGPNASGYPLDERFQRTDVVVMRSAHEDSRALYLASRVGGDVDRGHTHLDRGSFVFSANGQQWFEDLGPDNYSLGGIYDSFGSPSYEDGLRWKIYRLRAEGHNTLVINPEPYGGTGGDPDQRTGDLEDSTTPVPVVEWESLNSASPFVITDLTPIYSGRAPWQNVQSVKRGLKMENRSSAIVQDEIAGANEVLWFAHTLNSAPILSENNTAAVLTKNGERLWCKILAGGVFEVRDAKRLSTSPPALSGENANTGWKKLTIRRTDLVGAPLTISVLMVPLSSGQSPPSTLPSVTPLASWTTATPETSIYSLLVSSASNHSSPAPLSGKTVSGNIYAFTSPDSGVYQVRFYLDDPTMTGNLRRTESNAPYDFAGGTVSTASPFDTRNVSNGSHTITAAVELSSGGTEVVHATFTIAN